ncbi:CBM35 domain-containing protein [Streptomyces sp. HPF1205]|uniref:CBM35 domain-containing protein n=1 Tax=Streptomyces sp. HPF1205 TaxID=2873262 RepID=UPI001CEDED16|nr:carbohydrate-binding protein [Streptomyces sp. HPF1205]
MTAGHDGTPENDDPFAYLYRSDGGEQPDPAQYQGQGPGQATPRVPRTSYNQVQRVGERRVPQPGAGQQGGYGYPQQQGGYGYPQQQYGQQQGYGQEQPYGTREYTAPQQQPPGGGGRRGYQDGPPAPNRKGLLIAAVAVVAAVAIGITVAVVNGSGDSGKKNTADTHPTTAPATSTAPSTQPTPSAAPTPFASKPVDAATLTLAGGAQTSTQWPGANAAGGTYVDHMTAVGASATWNVTVPEDGPYTLFISYGNAGADANLTLVVNGTPRTDPVNLRNYGHYTDWSKAWDNHTYNWLNLKKGPNTLTLACGPNQQCGVNLDQVWLKQGQVTK